jgi:hypothetical protein
MIRRKEKVFEGQARAPLFFLKIAVSADRESWQAPMSKRQNSRTIVGLILGTVLHHKGSQLGAQLNTNQEHNQEQAITPPALTCFLINSCVYLIPAAL